MKKTLIPVLVIIFLARMAAYAQTGNPTVTFQGGGGTTVPNMVDSHGQALADTDSINGLTVRIGYFDAGFNVAANAGNLQALGAHWHLFGATNIRTLPLPGTFAGSFSATTQNGDPSFAGQHIDLWVFKTSDNLSPNFSTFGNVVEYGLYTSSATTGVNNWTFPGAAVPPANAISINTKAPTTPGGVGVDTAFWGTIGASSLELAAVPEPSCLALLGLGLFGLICRRVRR